MKMLHRYGELWCNALYQPKSIIQMSGKKRQGKNTPTPAASAVRATISFPPEVYETLEVIAKEKKVSLAWVVRDATEKYIADKWPLFKGQG
jgi:hypothetical protein